MQENLFAECHPFLVFFYFAAVIAITMWLAHPVVIGISFLSALCYRLWLGDRRPFLEFQWKGMLPVFCLIVCFNAAFNHYGVTPLYYMKTGAITLESIVYGAVLGMILWTSMLWFSSVNLIFTTDKLVYLFGRFFPAMGLFLSMVFRFVPRFQTEWHRIREGQACLGKDIFQVRGVQKFHCITAEISILLTWALESGVAMVDSMHSRGYGVGKRSFYHPYVWSHWDLRIAAGGILLFFGSVTGLSCYVGKSEYDPVIRLGGFPVRPESIATYVLWFLFCFYPVFLSLFGEIWQRRQRGRIINHS